jgi:hypothetical protein
LTCQRLRALAEEEERLRREQEERGQREAAAGLEAERKAMADALKLHQVRGGTHS